MRLDNERESENVEDRRGSGGGFPIGGRNIGIGTIVFALVALYFGVDPSLVMNHWSRHEPECASRGATYSAG